MSLSIEFHRQSFTWTVEVKDIVPNAVLPPKLASVKLRILHQIPESRFRWSKVLSQFVAKFSNLGERVKIGCASFERHSCWSREPPRLPKRQPPLLRKEGSLFEISQVTQLLVVIMCPHAAGCDGFLDDLISQVMRQRVVVRKLHVV